MRMYKYLESKVFTRSGKIHETKKAKRTEIEKCDSVFNMNVHLLLSE